MLCVAARSNWSQPARGVAVCEIRRRSLRVGADLAGEDLVEQVWAPAFEPSQRRRSGRADGAKTVDIAFRVINGFWSSWGAAVLAVGVEDLADPNDRLWRAGSLPRMDYRGPRPAVLEGPPLVGRNGASRPDAFQT